MTQCVFGILRIAESDIALDANHLLEVVWLDAPLAPRPLAPAWSLGTLSLRGQPVPVIDLGRLLGLQTDSPQGEGFVAIVAYRGGRFGMRITHVRDVINAKPAQLHELTDGEGAPHALTPHLLEHPDLDRPVYVLDLDALFALENMVAVRTPVVTPAPELAESTVRPAQRWLIAVRGETTLALDACVVREVATIAGLEAPTLALVGYLGRAHRRDFTLPLFDPCHLIGLAAGAERPALMAILDGEEGDVALALDRVLTLVNADGDRPHAGAGYSDVVNGVVTTPEHGDALAIDHRALLAGTNVASLARLHADLQERRQGAILQRAWHRYPFVYFACGGELATPLDQLEAVEAAPTEYARNDQAAPFLGVWRHQGHSVSLVDLRVLLGRDASRPAQHVLIADGGAGRVGFLVDSTQHLAYIEAPANSMTIRWRGDSRSQATLGEQAKRLVSLGEGERRQVLALVCLKSLAGTLMRSARPEVEVEVDAEAG